MIVVRSLQIVARISILAVGKQYVKAYSYNPKFAYYTPKKCIQCTGFVFYFVREQMLATAELPQEVYRRLCRRRAVVSPNIDEHKGAHPHCAFEEKCRRYLSRIQQYIYIYIQYILLYLQQPIFEYVIRIYDHTQRHKHIYIRTPKRNKFQLVS